MQIHKYFNLQLKVIYKNKLKLIGGASPMVIADAGTQTLATKNHVYA